MMPCCMQVGLAATPSTAGFLSAEERQWVDARQRASLVARESEYARSSNAWGAQACSACLSSHGRCLHFHRVILWQTPACQ